MCSSARQEDVLNEARKVLYQRGFDIIRPIGDGGFATVYLIKSRQYSNPDSDFVVKLIDLALDESHSLMNSFKAEIGALTKLCHPHVIQIFDYFTSKTLLYMILEYCPHGCIKDVISKQGAIHGPIVGQLFRGIFSALSFCHSKGIAHRDIKPSNILLDKYSRAKLADFGLSLRTVAGQKHRRFGGSFVFTAPEIFQKQLHDPMAGDVWALGVVFAMMATGKSPWPCDSVGGLKKLVSLGNYQLRKPVPDSIANLIGKMLVVDPSKRLTMKQVAAHPVFTRVTGVSPRVSRSFRVTRPGFAWRGMVRSSSQMLQGMDLSTESSDAVDEPRAELQTGRVHAISCAILNKRPHIGVKQRMNTTHLQASVFHTFPEDDVEEF